MRETTERQWHREPGWPLIRRSLLRARASLAALGAWSLLEAVPAMASGVLVAKAVDEGFLRLDLVTGLSWLAALLAAYAIGAVGTRFTFPIIGRIVEPLRDELTRAVVAGIVHADGPATPDGSMIARVTQQVEAVRRSIATLLNGLRRFVFTLSATAAGLAALGPGILSVAMPPVIVSTVLFVLLLRRLSRRQRAAMEANERVALEVSEAFAGSRDIAAFRGQDRVVAGVGRCLAAERTAQRRLGQATAARSAVTAVGAYLPLLCLLLAAPWLIGRGVTIGAMLGAATYLSTHVEAAMRMLTEVIGGSGLQLAVTVRRLADAHRGVRPPQEGTATPPAGGEIVADGVGFAYHADAAPVIDRLGFALPENGHLAVVGPSGTGKSTLAALIAGLAVPGSGRISVGGTAPHRLDPEGRPSHIVLVPQESYVFSGTLGQNLRYLRRDASDRLLAAAAGAVGAEDLCARLGGWDAPIEPARLSAGERQLIGVARAYLSRARVVILDEATCHLDHLAEARVERAFRDRPGTLVVIAHRAASAMRADHILLLDGVRTYWGDHEQLTRTCGLYAELTGRPGR
ncbi:ABC transporter ATP-binding protein [Microbispora sp. NPDC088329]|uniref:ABC transporter ATP-binding protein n=1 Tax=Microbispora sp. NPDC088329 TaxID=3154869 RepID=UPI003433347F